MSYKAHNRVLLSASLLVILVSFMITITQGAEHSPKTEPIIENCSDAVSTKDAGTDCQGQLSTPEFLTILMVGLGLAGTGFTVRRLSNSSSPH